MQLFHRIWRRLTYQRTIDNLRSLCKSIEDNRRAINEISSRVRSLEMRVWEMEGHSAEETVAMCQERISKWCDYMQKYTQEAAQSGT